YLGATFSFFNKLFDIAPEILIGVAIDVVVNQERSFLAKWGVEQPLHQLIFLSVLTLLIWVLESIFEYLLLVRWRNLAQFVQHDLRVTAYSHLQKLDMAYFEDRSTGGLVAVLNDDINQLERFFNEGINSLIQIMTSIILIGAVFFAIAPQVAVFAFLPMPIILLGAFYFQKKAAPLYAEVREKAGLIGGRLANNITGIATIRSFTAENREASLVTKDSQAYVDANRRAIAVSARFNPIIRMGVLSGFLATFVFGGILTLRGDLNVGSYGVLVFLTQRLLWPMRDLAGTVDLFERAMASADRVLNLLRVPTNLEKEKSAGQFSAQMNVEIKDVSFSYNAETPVLNHVNMTVPAGKTVAIVGPTGSGKSTITKLLLHFYKASSGSVLVGGVNVDACDLQALRSRIGLVSQDVFLFHGTIYENIAYGKPGATREEVMAAARKAYADEFIDRLPQGLDTLIGERGQKLSGGQRQRLSIARVILKNPPVLILDEATSAVDNETESVIQKSLAEVSKGRTTIVIAHRLSTVTHADNIYVLAQGKVVEQGTHAELLHQNQVYSQLWNLQIRQAQLT
ncbi:MAG TPA: ABC transporter ATP-binding protein, partial [Bdellovibrio sp.]